MATHSSNTYLTESEMRDNASYIYSYLTNEGWSINAIAGMLGNMQIESTINPGIWQSLDYGNMDGGYGLVQWTPATTLINWCNENSLGIKDIDSQLKRILYELDNGLQYYPITDYPLSFREYTVSTKSPSYLASAFLKNYERAGVEREAERQENAEYWYQYLSGKGFTPRLDSSGIEGSYYWYAGNPFYQSGYGLPNCTCYAFGRFWEISDRAGDYSNKPTLPLGDAGTWYSTVTGYEKGSTPQLGAVICWSDNSGGAGHVAIVEQIKENGDIVTSNSGYPSTFFWTETIYKSNGYNSSGYTFQGFIYNPFSFVYVPDEGGSTGTYRKRKGYNFLLMNAERRRKQWTKTNFYRRLGR